MRTDSARRRVHCASSTKVLCTFGFAIVSVCVSWRASGSVILSVGSGTVTQGDSTTVDLNISGLGNGTALGTFDVDIGFDPTIVSFSSATYGDPILGDQLNLEGFGTITETTPAVGTTELFELSFDSPSALTSQQATGFTLATLTFDGINAGTSPLALSVIALGDQNGNSIAAALESGSITVTGAPAGVPEPGAVWLFLCGLLSLGIAQRPSAFASPKRR